METDRGIVVGRVKLVDDFGGEQDSRAAVGHRETGSEVDMVSHHVVVGSLVEDMGSCLGEVGLGHNKVRET